MGGKELEWCPQTVPVETLGGLRAWGPRTHPGLHLGAGETLVQASGFGPAARGRVTGSA